MERHNDGFEFDLGHWVDMSGMIVRDDWGLLRWFYLVYIIGATVMVLMDLYGRGIRV